LDFSSSIWLADENGNIYYARRDKPDPEANEITFRRVSTPDQRTQFSSRDELHGVPQFGHVRPEGTTDGSVAAVKMLLTMGIATASIPKGSIHLGDGITLLGTSYVINLASFTTTANAFWPNELTNAVHMEPVPPEEGG
jgi:hypothetical protein